MKSGWTSLATKISHVANRAANQSTVRRGGRILHFGGGQLNQVTVGTMAAIWLSFVLAAACFSSLDAAIIKKGHQMMSFEDLHKIDEHHNLHGNEQMLRELSAVEELLQVLMEDTVEDALFDSMPDEDDEKDELVLRGDERRVIPFWNRTKLCNYHECFRQLKTWPEVPYYLLKDGHFLVDWPTKYIRMFLIYNKNAFVKVFNKDRQAVENHALETVAIIDKAYRTVNFRVLLSGVEILEEFWPGETENPHYSQYLKPKVREHIWSQLQSSEKKFDTAAYIAGPPYWHGTSASGAGMGDLCVVKDVNAYPFMMIGSSGIKSTRPADLMDVFTHEMGHQFFLGHPFDPLDGGEYPCPTKKLFGSSCTMGGNKYPKSFGHNFFTQFRKRDFSCLDNKPAQGEVFKCGNGVLDSGEECDCGSSQDCLERNPCCDGGICKLKRGAQCTDGQACCKNCKMDLESCPVEPASLSKRAWAPLAYTSTYKEITSPTSGSFEAIPFGRLTPQNKVFSWLLRAPVGQRVRVVLTVPQMMSEYFEVWIGCPYDWIEVRDGGEVTSPLIGRYCTPLRNPILWSSSNEMLVRLRSDSSFDSHFVIGYTFKPKEDNKDEEEEEKTCQIGDGSSYRGTLAATWSGRLCQAWGVQAPHSHSRTPANYPNSGLDKNYCRNPSGHHNLWCYTADPDKRWDSCVLRKCDTVLEDLGAEVQDLIKDAGECYTGKGTSYRGTTTLTWSGHTCQAWSSQTPHSHSYTPEKYPNAGLTNNYCRNPSKSDAPWCYTTSSKRWAFCAIPKCMENEGT
ncbi:uncharacterized protein LOC144863351 isoform X2 [Branchiostoma floridae x Branchiostoma japonicum]